MSNDAISVKIFGERGAGKTTFLYKLFFKYNNPKPDQSFKVIPTESYNVEMIPYRRWIFQMWDFADINVSRDNISNTRVLIHFIDAVKCAEAEVMIKARETLSMFMQQFSAGLEKLIIITVANKCSSPGAVSMDSLNRALQLSKHHWRLFPCDAINYHGIDAVLEYLVATLDNTPLGTVTPWEEVKNPYHLHDDEFCRWFDEGRPLLFLDQYSLLRILYLTLRKQQMRTRQLLKQCRNVLDALEVEMITVDGRSQTTPDTPPSIAYSETRILFWIQMVSYALLRHPVDDKPFHGFLMECPELWDEDCWKTYYSGKVFFSDKACQEFIPPDKKPLPNAFRPSSLSLQGSGLKIQYQSVTSKR